MNKSIQSALALIPQRRKRQSLIDWLESRLDVSNVLAGGLRNSMVWFEQRLVILSLCRINNSIKLSVKL